MNAPMPSTAAPIAARPPTLHLVIAFALLYVVWGSTYLGMAMAVETMPPLLMAAIRFAVAGGLLYAILRLRGEARPGPRQWGSALLVGTLLFLGGNGVVCLAEEAGVPSGVAALIIATTPLWLTVLPWLVRRSPRPHAAVFAGIAIGLLGVGVLIGGPGLATTSTRVVLGMLAIVASSLSWAIGSLWAKALPLPTSPWMSSALQMLCGSIGLTLAGLLSGERLDPATISARSGWALVYLILIGAIIGFGSFVYLMRWSTPARVSTYAYVNPMVAVLLGWLFANEAVTGRILVAGALIIASVVLILIAGKAGSGLRRAT
jgi:drug/metabolite transporter (DMT)-like permease